MRAAPPRRYLLLAAALVLSSCAARSSPPQATLALPPSPESQGKVGPLTPISGQLSVVTAAQKPVGNLVPVYIAIANGTDSTRTIHPNKVFALNHYGQRVASLSPLEAARRAGGANQLKTSIENGPLPVAGDGAANAAQGASSKTLPAKVPGQSQPSAQLTGLTLSDTEIRKDATVSGYIFFPKESYTDLEMLVINNDTGATETVTLPWR